MYRAYSNKLLGSFCLKPSRNHRFKHLNISGAYQPKIIEKNVDVNNRENSKLFNRNGNESNRIKYSSILPPPNVTGNLHLGHALMATIQDVICRWKHMNGADVQWIPGLDHAGIATQVVVEKLLRKEKKLSRHDIGREAFLQEVWKWKEEKGNQIINDLTAMGTLFNWNEKYFTMDEHQSEAVVEAFIRLFEDKLIYRKEAIVNWSCSLESAISDIEVETIEINGPTQISVPGYSSPITFGEIFDIVYKSLNGNDKIIISTTRPETLLGDVAVAVNPNDPRYAHLHGKNTQLWHPFRNEPIPLIFDEFVNIETGTGAVKITPAHSKIDLDVAQKHNLPIISVIEKNGEISSEFKNYAGQRRFNAREQILSDLVNLGLFCQKKSHKMQLPLCSRSNDVIEYLVKSQWFMRCSELEEAAVRAVDDGRLTIDPPKFEKEWKRWLNEHMDWCLSRQLWWGHRIPAFECQYKDKTIWIAAHSTEEAIEKAMAKFQVSDRNKTNEMKIKQDEDVLDTWFSSGILAFAVFGWPQTLPSNKYYPLDIIVTGHDILFFWVARMTMLSMHLTGKLPFKKILLHGLICDAQGKKMSKSRGNVVTPTQIINGASIKEITEDLKQSFRDGTLTNDELVKSINAKKKTFPKGIPECGIDALRFTLCTHDIREHFIHFDVNECQKNKFFLNKIWNAVKFTLDKCEKFTIAASTDPKLIESELTVFDRWILSRLANTIKISTSALNEFNFHLATIAWKRFFYENLCDVYLENTKLNLWNGIEPFAQGHCEVLKTCFGIGLKQMGVFTPFLANELLNYFPSNIDTQTENWIDNSIEIEIENILQICASIRQLKSENKILKKQSPKTHLFANDKELIDTLTKYRDYINFSTFSVETILNCSSIIDSNEWDKFIVKSTSGHLCAFGITVEDNTNIIIPESNVRNQKKLNELQTELEKLITADGTLKAKNKDLHAVHLEKVKHLKTEIATINALIK